MGYLGRVLGIGKTSKGEIAGIYAVSGRSKESKSRLARVIDEGLIKKVSIGPIKEPTKEQIKTGNLLFYNAIIATDKICPSVPYNSLPYIAITNGVQTDTLFEVKRARYDNGTESFVLRNTLNLFGHEPDYPTLTPRIAGEILGDGVITNGGKIGIVSSYDSVVKELGDPASDWNPGNFYIASTYSVMDDVDLKPPKKIGLELILKGETAEELASEFYNWMDERYVVCSAAAVFDRGKESWQVASKNSIDLRKYFPSI